MQYLYQRMLSLLKPKTLRQTVGLGLLSLFVVAFTVALGSTTPAQAHGKACYKGAYFATVVAGGSSHWTVVVPVPRPTNPKCWAAHAHGDAGRCFGPTLLPKVRFGYISLGLLS